MKIPSPILLQKTFASNALDVMKMKAFVPCEVENQHKTYKCRIVEVVYDPFRITEVNGRFQAEGYDIGDSVQVIAVNEDGSILVWGGFNSIFHLRKGEKIENCFDLKHLAFDDILVLTQRFKIKHKKGEVGEFIEQLKKAYET